MGLIATGTPSINGTVPVTPSITVPSGVLPAHYAYILVAWEATAGDNPPVITPSGAGWSAVIAARTENNSGFAIFVKQGLTATDTFTVTTSIAKGLHVAHAYDTDGPGTPGAVTGRAGVSGATTTAATSTTSTASQRVLIASMERTTATGTTVTDDTGVTRWLYSEATIGSNTSAYLAEFAGPGTPGATPAKTQTYSGPSGNGAAVQIPLVPPVAGGTLTRAVQGMATSNSVRASALTAGATSVRLAVSTAAGMTSPSYGAAQVPDAQGYSKHERTGLAAATDYWWQMEVDGALTGPVGQTRTLPAPGGQTSFSFMAAACSFTGSTNAIFTAMRTRALGTPRAAFFAHMGDLHYTYSGGGSAPNDPVPLRAAYESGLQSATQAPLYRDVPWDHVWSDNDFCGSNSDSTYAGRPAAITARRQVLADPPLPDTGGLGLWKTWVIGRVRFIRTDSRTYMALKTSTDDAAKSMLGAEQKAWLKARLSDPEPVKVWLHDNAWGGAPVAVGSGVDTWQVFTTERAELAAYITANAVRVLYVHGDAHRLSFDDGTNNPYGGFAVAGAAPMDQDAQRTQPVTVQSAYPAPAGVDIAGAHLYGWFDVTDSGTSIAVAFTGYDGAGVAQVTGSKTFTGITAATATGSLAALQFAWFGARAAGTSRADREMAYFAGLSGLPAGRSLTDHKRAYYSAQLGLSAAAAAATSISDLERDFWAMIDPTNITGSWADRARRFYGS